jgi:hypothetical protein
MPLLSESYSAGFHGTVTAGGIDWDVDTWEATKTTEWADTTNTGNYDSTDNTCWDDGIPTTTKYNGTFTASFSKVKNPFSVIDSGAVIPANFVAIIGKSITGNIGIDSIAVNQGGIKGVVKFTVTWHSLGKMVNPT